MLGQCAAKLGVASITSRVVVDASERQDEQLRFARKCAFGSR